MKDLTPKRLLVALDGSKASLDAVVYLASVMPASDTTVVLFTVTTRTPESFWDVEGDPISFDPADAWLIRRKMALEEFMDKAGKIFLEAGFTENQVQKKIQYRTVGIARDIIREAAKGYDAVVTGRVGMNPITRLVMGSVANKLVDNIIGLPVWLIGRAVPNKKFLIAMDGSEGAVRCVRHAGKILSGTDAEFTLFHVLRDYDLKLEEIRESDVSEIEKTRWKKITDEEQKKTRSKMYSVMENASSILEQSGFSSDRITTKILTGMATRGGAITAQALLGGYSTIIIGRRGLSEVGEFNMGRVCYKVVQLAGEMAVWVVN